VTSALLYIEDSPDNVQLVQRILRKRPEIELRVANTGQEGVQTAVDSQPALILLDNRLPDATGIDVLRQLAASPATAAIPVLIVSGDTGGTVASELAAAGAAGFITKPFDIHHLLAEIDKHVP
jgi:CheY-like chemotaxis protein